MSQSSVIDAVGLSIIVAASVFSPKMAEVVGPYVLIATAAVIGASFALARRSTSSRWAAVFYFLRVVGLAILLTVGLSAWLSTKHPDFSERALLAPVALLIGFVGDGWPALLSKIVSMLYGFIDIVRGKGGVQ
ncbi:hypothetical protein NF681_11500 [Comamonadaceae bacterium OTU4NAUVB1]|nr:hypothetical protein NF681_11500 [Comamonadaceae bacterium OTU4NAUVB1]